MLKYENTSGFYKVDLKEGIFKILTPHLKSGPSNGHNLKIFFTIHTEGKNYNEMHDIFVKPKPDSRKTSGEVKKVESNTLILEPDSKKYLFSTLRPDYSQKFSKKKKGSEFIVNTNALICKLDGNPITKNTEVELESGFIWCQRYQVTLEAFSPCYVILEEDDKSISHILLDQSKEPKIFETSRPLKIIWCDEVINESEKEITFKSFSISVKYKSIDLKQEFTKLFNGK